ncbi:MAG: hypothetical protein WCF26_02330 [Candidatus Sulfotelmatobacter sp.]
MISLLDSGITIRVHRHVPKHDDRSCRAWLYGKLLIALLTQKLIRIGRDISPSGNLPSAHGTMQSVA